MDNQFKKLSEPLAVEAIQKTIKQDTKKGYDTTGYGYQYCVNRFNELYEDKWGFDFEIIKEREGAYKSGQPFSNITVIVSIWITDKTNARKCVGGHISATYEDALKGAITNGFKKTAAFWGVGRQAYEGSIDDDNKPYPEDQKEIAQPQQTPKDEVKKAQEFANNAVKSLPDRKPDQDYSPMHEPFGQETKFPTYGFCSTCFAPMYLKKDGTSIYCSNYRDKRIPHDSEGYKGQPQLHYEINTYEKWMHSKIKPIPMVKSTEDIKF